jgi:hypothetical protein
MGGVFERFDEDYYKSGTKIEPKMEFREIPENVAMNAYIAYKIAGALKGKWVTLENLRSKIMEITNRYLGNCEEPTFKRVYSDEIISNEEIKAVFERMKAVVKCRNIDINITIGYYGIYRTNKLMLMQILYILDI